MARKTTKKAAIYAQIPVDSVKKLRAMVREERLKLTSMLELLIEDGWQKRSPSYR